jgi:hypothetical protein
VNEAPVANHCRWDGDCRFLFGWINPFLKECYVSKTIGSFIFTLKIRTLEIMHSQHNIILSYKAGKKEF